MDDVQPPAGDADRASEAPGDPALDAQPVTERRRRRRFQADPRRIRRGITTAAVVVAAVVGAAALGITSGLLTLFGWGLAIVVAILAVGVAAAIRPRPVNGWLLVPVLALAVPSAAVAISGVRVLPQRGPVVAAPATAGEIPDGGYHAGLGDLLVDLRGLAADRDDRILVPARSDLGRTVIALPQDRCFNLDVRWRTGNLRLPRVQERPTAWGLRPGRPLSRLGQQSPRNRKRWGTAPGRIVLFGRAYDIAQGRWVAPTIRENAPTLTLELASEGGSFVVRTYPDRVAPLRATGWPLDQRPPPNLEFIGQEGLSVTSQPGRTRPNRGGIVDGVSGEGPLADHMRANIRHRKAFAREWARRVTGTCNPKGAFR